jgi:hypothetical protein
MTRLRWLALIASAALLFSSAYAVRNVATVKLPQESKLTIHHQGQVYIRIDGLDNLKPFTDVTITLVVDPKTLRVAPIEGSVEHDGTVEVTGR